MAKRWSGTKQFNQLSGTIATLDSRDFQRRILSLMKLIWPDLVEPRDLRSWDRSGVDFIVPSDNDPVPVVVQVKGFIAKDGELGDSHAKQIAKSIQSFLDCGRKANRYLMVLNRETGKKLHYQIQAELKRLVQAGVARRAELWSRRKLLHEVFDGVYFKLHSALEKSRSTTFTATHQQSPPFILSSLPHRHQELVVDQHMLQSEGRNNSIVADPVQVVIDNAGSRTIMLIGEFGYGKTTALRRFVSSNQGATFFAEGAMVSSDTVGTKHLLHQLVDTEALLGDCDDEVRADRDSVSRAVIGKIFCSQDLKLTLVIDALDESAPLARSGGLQWLFNALRDIQVPVVLSARTEFWRSKQRDFATSFGDLARDGQPRRQRIVLVELLPWTESEISELVRQHANSDPDQQVLERLEALAKLIDQGDYESYYGDIPKRPLFLTLLIDTVRREGVQPTRRGTLFRRWIEYKIGRDVRAPIQTGGSGRLPIVANSLGEDDTIRLAWQAMELAAISMTQVGPDGIELLSDCDLTMVLSKHPRLAAHGSELAVVLNSLLVPQDTQRSSRVVSVRFAHRAFQEYFLASYVLSHPGCIDMTLLPDTVTDWLSEIDSAETTAG